MKKVLEKHFRIRHTFGIWKSSNSFFSFNFQILGYDYNLTFLAIDGMAYVDNDQGIYYDKFKVGKFWSITPDNFIKHKSYISEE